MSKLKYLHSGHAGCQRTRKVEKETDSAPVLHGTEYYREIQEIMATISFFFFFPSGSEL